MDTITQQKVVHLTSVHPPGDTRIAHRECATLVEAGYDVVLIAAGSGRGLPAGVRFRGLDLPRNRFERMTRTLWNVYRSAVAERADIYHFHDPELIGVALALRLSGARVIFDVHEDIPRDIIDKPWIPRPLRRPIALGALITLRGLQRCFSAIVTATPSIAKRFPHPRTAVISNYPRLEELSGSTGRPFRERERAVAYVGEISRLRGARQMVECLQQVPDGISLTLVGAFENSALRDDLQAMPGWSRVRYMGRRQRSELAAIFASVRAGLLLMLPAANHIDALPTKVFEYMAAGLPVVLSSAVPLCADIVRTHECGIVVDVQNAAEVARAVSFLVEHPDEAEEMGRRGQRAVAAQYQWATEGVKLADLYANIA
jgi:glycosyltransferase involved in cell wall biosynthesis